MQKVGQKSSTVVSALLDYLKESGEENLLPEISLALVDILKDSKKAKEVVVTSATTLSSKQQDDLKTSFKKLFSVDLPFVYRVDKKVLGGFTLRVADWYLDASLANELSKLKKKLLV